MIKSFLFIIFIFLILILIVLNSFLIKQHRDQYDYIKIQTLKYSNLYAQDIAEELTNNVNDFSHLQKSLYIRNKQTLVVTKNLSFEEGIKKIQNIQNLNTKEKNKCNLNLYRNCHDKIIVYCLPNREKLSILCTRYEHEYALEARNANIFYNKQSLIFQVTESKLFLMNNPKFFSRY